MCIHFLYIAKNYGEMTTMYKSLKTKKFTKKRKKTQNKKSQKITKKRKNRFDKKKSDTFDQAAIKQYERYLSSL